MIDYQTYDALGEFPLELAAALWMELNPDDESTKFNSGYKAKHFEINMAVNNRELQAGIFKIQDEPTYKSSLQRDLDDFMGTMGRRDEPRYSIVVQINRADLKNWAESKGQKPKFLFPEMRLNQDPIQNKSAVPNLEEGRPDDRINSLLKIILGMAIDAYKYDPDAQKNKATGGNSGSIAAALENIPGLKTDPDTIRNYLTEASRRFPSAKPHKS
ncbi:hypothetical protein ACH5Y9_10675 [Methylomonas sp. BW4-1]|uniref:Uncharacterized protein n=1 Tax=Methylomonas defluvii TaxID=3045149 RepID=A0ABU4UEE4_9GAMM|nr:hypothetical protein [Methylomonas sp. OY6]MDX8127740.1 hypothetical protein [Methylomonas sp. OY6]